MPRIITKKIEFVLSSCFVFLFSFITLNCHKNNAKYFLIRLNIHAILKISHSILLQAIELLLII